MRKLRMIMETMVLKKKKKLEKRAKVMLKTGKMKTLRSTTTISPLLKRRTLCTNKSRAKMLIFLALFRKTGTSSVTASCVKSSLKLRSVHS